eukprot:2209075-Prymnesium_polylepis.1
MPSTASRIIIIGAGRGDAVRPCIAVGATKEAVSTEVARASAMGVCSAVIANVTGGPDLHLKSSRSCDRFCVSFFVSVFF